MKTTQIQPGNIVKTARDIVVTGTNGPTFYFLPKNYVLKLEYFDSCTNNDNPNGTRWMVWCSSLHENITVWIHIEDLIPVDQHQMENILYGD